VCGCSEANDKDECNIPKHQTDVSIAVDQNPPSATLIAYLELCPPYFWSSDGTFCWIWLFLELQIAPIADLAGVFIETTPIADKGSVTRKDFHVILTPRLTIRPRYGDLTIHLDAAHWCHLLTVTLNVFWSFCLCLMWSGAYWWLCTLAVFAVSTFASWFNVDGRLLARRWDLAWWFGGLSELHSSFIQHICKTLVTRIIIVFIDYSLI
jgi:hypothetical protein